MTWMFKNETYLRSMNSYLESKSKNILLYLHDSKIENNMKGMSFDLKALKSEQELIYSLDKLLLRKEEPIIITDLNLNSLGIISKLGLESRIIRIVQNLEYENLKTSRNQILAFSNERIFQDLLFQIIKKILLFKNSEPDLSLSYGAFIHKCLITGKTDLQQLILSLESFFHEFQKHEFSKASWDKIIHFLQFLIDDLFLNKNIYSTNENINVIDYIKEKPILIKWGRDKNTFSFGVKEMKGLINFNN
jgi:hypothetical protein